MIAEIITCSTGIDQAHFAKPAIKSTVHHQTSSTAMVTITVAIELIANRRTGCQSACFDHLLRRDLLSIPGYCRQIGTEFEMWFDRLRIVNFAFVIVFAAKPRQKVNYFAVIKQCCFEFVSDCQRGLLFPLPVYLLAYLPRICFRINYSIANSNLGIAQYSASLKYLGFDYCQISYR